MLKTTFYFRIEEEADLGIDENGNPAAVFTKVAMKHGKPFKDDTHKKNIEQAYRSMIANNLDIDKQYVQPITEQEYVDNVDEE